MTSTHHLEKALNILLPLIGFELNDDINIEVYENAI